MVFQVKVSLGLKQYKRFKYYNLTNNIICDVFFPISFKHYNIIWLTKFLFPLISISFQTSRSLFNTSLSPSLLFLTVRHRLSSPSPANHPISLIDRQYSHFLSLNKSALPPPPPPLSLSLSLSIQKVIINYYKYWGLVLLF